MNAVNVLIPTYDRLALLRRCLASLEAQLYPNVRAWVMVDGNLDTLRAVRDLPMAGLRVVWNDQRIDWVASMNRLLQLVEDGPVLYAADDVEFAPQSIMLAVAKLYDLWPDGDGMVTIRQDVRGASAAFGLFGQVFAARFPERRVFCPDYIHYGSDTELGRYASWAKRLCNDCGATLRHDRGHDTTYRMAQAVKELDYATIEARQQAGLLWGRDATLLRSAP